MNLSKFIENFSSRIVGGSDYTWDCFGYNARYLDFESEHAYATVVFDSKNQTVYMAQVSCKDDHEDNLPDPYDWYNPTFKQKYLDECKLKNVEPHHAWDDVSYINLEVPEDFLEKSYALFNNLPFDRRIVVPMDLDDDVILSLALEAHKRDITINKMIEIILQKAIDVHNKKMSTISNT